MADSGAMAFMDNLATRLSGRTWGQRALYNTTRAGLLNSATAPDDASPMGGLGQSLKSRRAQQGREAQSIEDAVFAHQRPVTE